MRKSASAAVVALAVVTLVGHVRQASAADKWVSVRSQNFLLVGNASEGRIRQVAGDLERFRAAFALLFPGAGQQSSATTTVVVFKDDSAFRPFKPVYQDKPANVDAYFQSGFDVNFIALNGEIDTPALIYHEFVHSLTRDTTRRLPSWVSEGLAEFYSTFRSDSSGTSVELGRPVNHHVALLRQKPLIPLDTFLAVDNKSPYYNEQSKQGIFYAQSWALVHYLESGRKGSRRLQLSEYLSLVASGKPIDESFQAAFHTDYAGIEKELREYLGQFTMTFFKVALPTKLEVERGMQATPLSEGQTAAYLGDLMVHMGRADAAEKELARAIALDPTLPGSYVSMAMLRLRADKDKEALELLSKAVAGNTRDYVAHFVYAQLLEKLAAGESDDRRRARLELMRAHIKQAIEIAPHFVEAYDMLAFVALSLRTELSEAETAVRQAIDFAPGREDFRLVFADLMAVNGKELAARTVASAVRSSTTDEGIRRQADALLENLRALIEAAQARRDEEARRQAAGPPEVPRPGPSPSAPGTRPGQDAVRLRATPRVAGPQVEGFLTLIECDKGMNLHVRTERGSVLLHSDMPSQVNFISYVSTLKGSIVCGALMPERHVIVVYQRTTDPAYLGDPLVVEFHP